MTDEKLLENAAEGDETAWDIWVLLDADAQSSPDLAEAFKLLSKGNCCVFAAAGVEYYKKPPPPKK